GGPFRTRPADTFDEIRPEEALDHPNWDMGAKVTIDSATLMNKGLETIEARWMFAIEPDRIDVLVHPQSIIHSMVAFRDGSVKAQLGVPDMRVPIQYALSFPERWPAPHPRIDWSRLPCLDFAPPDLDRFPCLRLAFDALAAGGTAPAALNAANEEAVALFLRGEVRFTDIPRLVEGALEADAAGSARSLDGLVEADRAARARVAELHKTLTV
ncbi:MAG: 1-deoxy-D-xylulose-5-phosphate reductoisomerase, partial [Rhodothermales bacterium]|nr:1-deoxy-D-xylulose-5-phosphate reductoisomerase [Rhodothermales bacterium]